MNNFKPTSKQQDWIDQLNYVTEKIVKTKDLAPMLAKVSLGSNNLGRYSFGNQFLSYIQLDYIGGSDAMGIKAWNKLGRKPVKGFNRDVGIWAPVTGRYYVETEGDDGEVEKKPRVYTKGYVTVWILSDLQTEPWPGHEDIWANPSEQWASFSQTLPLIEVAEAIGCSVKGVSKVGGANGSFSLTTRKIKMMVASESTFFHELAHAVDDTLVVGGLKGGQDPIQEVVAQLAAETLVHLTGAKEESFGYTQRYIEEYSNAQGVPMGELIRTVTPRVSEIIGFIMDVSAQLNGGS